MNADEIRSLYVETLARARYEQFAATGDASGFPDYPWIDLPDNRRSAWIETAETLVDALAEAGLLPTETRWKTSGEAGDTPGWFPDRAAAVASWDRVQEECADMVGDWTYERPTLKREFTTGWREVSDTIEPCQCEPTACMMPLAPFPAPGCKADEEERRRLAGEVSQ